MGRYLLPSEPELSEFLLATLRHCCHVEYYLAKIGFNSRSVDRPHDIAGPGNKYEWEVCRGLALEFRNPSPDFEAQIRPCLERHRLQRHHRMLNPSYSSATANDFLLGGIDAICSRLEARGYQECGASLSDVHASIERNPPLKLPWLRLAFQKMQGLERPRLEAITGLEGFPNIGLPDLVYREIAEITAVAVTRLRRERGYMLK